MNRTPTVWDERTTCVRVSTSVPADVAGVEPEGSSALPVRTARARAAATARAYVALTKPRVIELLLVTTVPTMVLAAGGLPSWRLLLATLAGGAGAAAAANVLNCVLDRDIDQVMHRTSGRPLVTGAITTTAAVVFGLALMVASLTWLALAVNPVSAVLAGVAIAIYVVGYTMVLKRRTPQNIVWGGIAGCVPVLIGWSAVTGSVGWAALLLFGVVFFWTPPHYWPLSMKFRRDYAAAGVPMLPVVADDRRVVREMVGYTIAMIACSIALGPVGGLGWVYLVSAVLLGAWFGWSVVALLRRASDPTRGPLRAIGVFHRSITYLTVLSVAIVVDVLLPF
ncbi:MAG: heme o synthase [Actinobacteria bacterium]|nr:heme o synthase [Actinomycetota bacterium]